MTTKLNRSCLFNAKRRAAEGIFAIDADTRKYSPSRSLTCEPSPQSEPALFTDKELMTEVKYLIRGNARWGWHELRTMAYLDLLAVLQYRKESA